MVEFELVQAKQGLTTVFAEVEATTVIPARTLVGVTAGYIVKATAVHTEVAYTPTGCELGSKTIAISKGNEFILRGTADANYARATHAFITCDIVDSAGELQADLGSSATDVLKIKGGTQGSAENVEFIINKPLI